ncbi:MAG: chemotaxis protein CheA [Bacteroidota bacterium]
MENFKRKFLEEATEHVNDLEQSLLELESDPSDKELIERVFRAMHSLKGGGSMFGFEKISNFTHHLETIYDFLRNEQIELTKELLDLTLVSVDHIKTLLLDDDDEIDKKEHEDLSRKIKDFIGSIENKKTHLDSLNEQETQQGEATYYILFQPNENIFDNGTNPLFLVEELAQIGESIVIPHFNKLPNFQNLDVHKCYTYWEIIISTKENINGINDVFIFVEDDSLIEISMLSEGNLVKNKNLNHVIENILATGKETIINDLQEEIKAKDFLNKKENKKKKIEKNSNGHKENNISSIRVSSEKLDTLMNLVSELVTTQARLSLYAENDGKSELIAIAENVQKLTRQLRDNAFSIVLIPIENMLTRFQRLVRDLSKELGKDIVFIAEGADTELDKTIIENLTDPLMHILRNSIDHGIEKPGVREKLNKPEQGKIILKAFYSGANVHIQIIDDGAGLDPEKIKNRAIKKGLITEEMELSHKDLFNFIFIPGFSTAENVTDVSGRGVGMDVVKRKIAEIRGEVEVDSIKNEGTTLTIKLPLTLSVIDGLLVKIADDYYIIPLAAVHKIYAVKHESLVNNYNNLMVLDGDKIPYFYLKEEFEFVDEFKKMEEVVVIRHDDQKVALIVDSVIGEHQAVLKPLGKYYKNQDIISGASILGDGTVALVMDTNKAINFFIKHSLKNKEKIQ